MTVKSRANYWKSNVQYLAKSSAQQFMSKNKNLKGASYSNPCTCSCSTACGSCDGPCGDGSGD